MPQCHHPHHQLTHARLLERVRTHAARDGRSEPAAAPVAGRESAGTSSPHRVGSPGLQSDLFLAAHAISQLTLINEKTKANLSKSLAQEMQ